MIRQQIIKLLEAEGTLKDSITTFNNLFLHHSEKKMRETIFIFMYSAKNDGITIVELKHIISQKSIQIMIYKQYSSSPNTAISVQHSFHTPCQVRL